MNLPPRRQQLLLLAAILACLAALHVGFGARSEPFYNNDETRHVMTGVFFRDAILDLPVQNPKEYTVRYYMQYPALGLLTWPPLFYMIEGVWMLAFGPCFLAAKVLVGLFGALAVTYLFLLVCRTHDIWTAACAALLCGLAPVVFVHCRHVMLEVPTLAFGLAAVFHFHVYLESGRARHVWLAALASSFAALTRFDAIFLLPLFLLLILGQRQWRVFLKLHVWAAIATAIALVLPYYVLALRELGWVHFQTGPGTGDGTPTGSLNYANLDFYFHALPEQVGWVMLGVAMIGLGVLMLPGEARKAWPYLAMFIATFAVLAPYPEQELRHTIYAMPGIAALAAIGVMTLARWSGWASIAWVGGAGTIAATAAVTLSTPALYVRGYEQAAQYVLAETKDSRTCLFDSFLNGDFIFYIRRGDPERRLWVLRGDKLLYTVLFDPRRGYKEHVSDKREVLDVIFKYDPEYIVVEEPQIHTPLPASERLREALRENPDRFRLEKEIPIESNYRMFQGARLLVYRNLLRNPEPVNVLEFEMLGLGRNLDAQMNR